MKVKVPEPLLLGAGPQDGFLVITCCCIVFCGNWEGLREAGGTLPAFLQVRDLPHTASLWPNISFALQGC